MDDINLNTELSATQTSTSSQPVRSISAVGFPGHTSGPHKFWLKRRSVDDHKAICERARIGFLSACRINIAIDGQAWFGREADIGVHSIAERDMKRGLIDAGHDCDVKVILTDNLFAERLAGIICGGG